MNTHKVLLGLVFLLTALLFATVKHKSPEWVSIQLKLPKATYTPTSQPTPAIAKEDLNCMALNMYREAGNGTKLDMIAVGRVVMNRAESPQYPDNVCEVIYQKHQFSWTSSKRLRTVKLNNILEQRAYLLAKRAAREVLEGKHTNIVPAAIYYHANYVRPGWSRRTRYVARIGKHIFYRA